LGIARVAATLRALHTVVTELADEQLRHLTEVDDASRVSIARKRRLF